MGALGVPAHIIDHIVGAASSGSRGFPEIGSDEVAGCLDELWILRLKGTADIFLKLLKINKHACRVM